MPCGNLPHASFPIAAGKALINWVAGFKNAPEQPMPTQGWEHTAHREDVLELFKAFVVDFLDVPALIRGAGTLTVPYQPGRELGQRSPQGLCWQPTAPLDVTPRHG